MYINVLLITSVSRKRNVSRKKCEKMQKFSVIFRKFFLEISHLFAKMNEVKKCENDAKCEKCCSCNISLRKKKTCGILCSESSIFEVL